MLGTVSLPYAKKAREDKPPGLQTHFVLPINLGEAGFGRRFLRVDVHIGLSLVRRRKNRDIAHQRIAVLLLELFDLAKIECAVPGMPQRMRECRQPRE